MFDEYELGYETGYTKGLTDRTEESNRNPNKCRAPKGGDEQLWKEGYIDGYNKAYPKTLHSVS